MTMTQPAPPLSAPWGPSEVPTTALLTDHYELTMLRAALRAGTASRRCVFELFARRLPEGRRYGVVAGVGRALRALRHFRFDDESLRFLLDREVVDSATADWLADFAFRGDIWGYPEGEIYFPGSPVLIVESTFAEGVVLETLLLSIYNHDSAIASAASRMTVTAGDRPCIEMGSRRTQELAAVAAARAAYIAGFAATSNLEAGRRYGVPTRGTSAHAFTLLHGTEREAFARPDRRARRGHHAAGRHLRRVHRGPAGRRADLRPARRGAAGLRRPRRARHPGPGAAGRARRHPHQDHRHQRPGRVHDRRAVRPPRWTATGWAPPWSPAAATRPPASSTSWWPGRSPTSPTRRWSGWPRRARRRPRSAGASTPCAAARPRAWPSSS